MKKMSGVVGVLIGVWGLCSLSFVRVMEEKAVRMTDPASFSVQVREPFAQFMDSFLCSASFQYDRVCFPLETPLLLYIEEEEIHLPYTRERWLLIGRDYIDTAGRTDGYFIRYTEDDVRRKALIGGYPDSETLVELTFEYLDDDKWYVTDAYNDCYYSGVRTPADMEEARRRIAEENRRFIALYP
ncbi:MAG: hypothetical protein LUF85_16875 [Bacteroides sp.]|nr:hypothetical protein [Bacteroides sp.]